MFDFNEAQASVAAAIAALLSAIGVAYISRPPRGAAAEAIPVKPDPAMRAFLDELEDTVDRAVSAVRDLSETVGYVRGQLDALREAARGVGPLAERMARVETSVDELRLIVSDSRKEAGEAIHGINAIRARNAEVDRQWLKSQGRLIPPGFDG